MTFVIISTEKWTFPLSEIMTSRVTPSKEEKGIGPGI